MQPGHLPFFALHLLACVDCRFKRLKVDIIHFRRRPGEACIESRQEKGVYSWYQVIQCICTYIGYTEFGLTFIEDTLLEAK